MRKTCHTGGAGVIALVTCIWFSACAHSNPPRHSTAQLQEPRAQIAIGQPCPALSMSHAQSKPAYARVFIEAADVTGVEMPPSSAASAQPLTLEVTTARVAGALADDQRRVTLPWSRCAQQSACTEAQPRWTLEFTPELPDDAEKPIKLAALRLVRDGQSEQASPGVEVSTPDQRSVLVELPSPEGANSTRLVFTPYLIADDADLRALLECKRSLAMSTTAASN